MTKIDAIAVVVIAAVVFAITWLWITSINEEVIAAETCGQSLSSMSRFVYCEEGPL